MKYRRLDESGDMMFGLGLANFYIDQPEAVGQAIETRLRLQLGEWFLDQTSGTDWDGKVLGTGTQSTRDVEIRARIAETQGVTQLTAFSTGYNGDTRDYLVRATVDTEYGATSVAVSP